MFIDSIFINRKDFWVVLYPTLRSATIRLAAIAAVAWLLGTSFAVAAGPKTPGEPQRRVSAPPVDELLVAVEEEPWTAAVAAPVAARLQASGRSPLLIVISSPPTHEADWLATLAGTRRVTVFAASQKLKLIGAIAKAVPEMLKLDSGASDGSLLVAKRFWKQSRQAVVAPANDAEAIILGGSLAAALAVPLLIREPGETRTALAQVLHDLGVQEILVSVSDPAGAPAWARGRKYKSEILGPEAIQHRLIAAYGVEKIRNVVVARAPDRGGVAGRSAWLAPYMSFAHGSAVVLSHSGVAAVTEADVAQLVQREGLRPRTVTLLADYGSIGLNIVEIDADDEPVRPAAPPAPAASTPAPAPVAPLPAKMHYTVKTEPFIPRTVQQLAEYGVGRIPLESLADASVLFARGLLRDRLLANRPPRLLMVSNSGIIRRPLPLCETISRVTAEEMKNFGLHVDEFYGVRADTPEVLTAAKSASWIVYEGHLAYQDLFNVPSPRRASASDVYFNEELDDLEDSDPDHPREPPKRVEGPAPGSVPPRSVVPIPESNRLQGPLTGLPVVILQSCDSLDEPVLWRIDELGGVAVIGSVTPIHSGSGSALIHAAVGSVLYRGGTLGEALRDAQNYMFCVEDLKSRRGHKEQIKGRRVAVSFRLWGDPELRVLPAMPAKSVESPVAAQWTAPDTLTITVPARQLPEVRSNKYIAHMFPGSQAAGMVKPVEGETLRRLTPVYYFRMALPENFAADGRATLQPAGGDASRASVRIDRLGRLLYLVYFPEQEKPGDSIVLRWVAPREVERLGRIPQ